MRRLLLCVLAALCLAPRAADAVELYDTNGQSIDITVPPTWPAPAGLRRQPVLFVHGHAADTFADPNYKKNFWEDADDNLLLSGLTSFKKTLDDNVNSGLDIEDYYIRFADRNRSITDDAFDIGQAVDYIIRRHNENFDPATAMLPPPVQVVIIGYSKGTLSSRQYLKSLQVQVQDSGGISLPPPRPGYRPVSEFIAIAPPNHGIAVPLIFDETATDQISIQQLYNGVEPEGSGCGNAFNPLHPQAANFIEILNGETTLDSQVSNTTPASGEAPGSRRPTQGPHSGTLYVTLFDAAGRDRVGGDSPSSDCAGRELGSNLSSDAVNIPTAIPGFLNIHVKTVHTQDVVCKALFAAAHHRSPETQTCPLSGRVPIIPVPQPAAAMLTLDISGSMLATQCATCPNRYEILKQAVEIFARLWAQAGRSNDRLGVTYFRTTIDEPLIGGERLPELAGNVDTLILDVNGQNVVSTNLTAMGGGLQRSVEALRALPAAQAEARHVILFSDGMQNVNPMVLPPQHVVIDNDQTGRPSSGVTPTGLRLDQLSPLKVDTIAVGAGAFVNVLADIATHGRGLSRQTLDANDLRQFFVEQLIDTLRGSSPQLIGYRRGTLRGTSATEAFQVNRGARKLLFKVSWQRGQRLDVRVFKDGVDMTNSAQVVSGDFYRILTINSAPTVGRDPAPGQWRLRISGKSGTAYEAAAIIDDKALRYQARLEPSDKQPGAALGLTVQVTRDGRPIDGTVTATAIVTRPRVAIGNVLAAVKPVKAGSRGTEPGMTEPERQIAAFLQDQRLRDRLRPVTETIRLEDDKRGGFRAVLANATVPGLYRAEVRIAGEDRQLGRFERSQSVTATAWFGEADRARSGLTLRTLPRNQGIELTLRPADRLGNLLGPTLAGDVVLDLSAGKIRRGPDDLGDGRYRFVFLPPAGQDPTLTLAVAGRPLFKGTLKELQNMMRR